MLQEARTGRVASGSEVQAERDFRFGRKLGDGFFGEKITTRTDVPENLATRSMDAKSSGGKWGKRCDGGGGRCK